MPHVAARGAGNPAGKWQFSSDWAPGNPAPEPPGWPAALQASLFGTPLRQQGKGRLAGKIDIQMNSPRWLRCLLCPSWRSPGQPKVPKGKVWAHTSVRTTPLRGVLSSDKPEGGNLWRGAFSFTQVRLVRTLAKPVAMHSAKQTDCGVCQQTYPGCAPQIHTSKCTHTCTGLM